MQVKVISAIQLTGLAIGQSKFSLMPLFLLATPRATQPEMDKGYVTLTAPQNR